MEQVETLDGLGRGILMHAARSNHVDTFDKVFRIVRDAERLKHLGPVDGAQHSTKVDQELMKTFDNVEMSCLHHAAEAGCGKVLERVIQICTGSDISTFKDVNKADKRGRTPIMLVLKNSYSAEEEAVSVKASVKGKLDLLLKAMHRDKDRPGKQEWMKPVSISLRVPVVGNTKVIETLAVTELLHAARGGVASLEVVLSEMLPTEPVDGGFPVNLDEALDVREKEHGQWAVAKTWGRALLLGAAARLGSVDVLYHVLVAIKVRAVGNKAPGEYRPGVRK